MKKTLETHRYGIWIDHRKAILLHVDPEGRMEEETMDSGLSLRARYSGEETSKTGLFRHTLNRERSDQARFNLEYRKFVRSVITNLKRPSSLLILGPGDARHELQREIMRRKSYAGVEFENRPADKMRIAELRRTVKDHFTQG
jgi:hypothetical protein